MKRKRRQRRSRLNNNLKHVIKLIIGLVSVGVSILLFFLYAYFYEPNNLEIVNLTLSIEGLPTTLSGLTIVHLSDLHMKRIGKRERKVVEIVNEIRPDLVVITGDYESGKRITPRCMEFMNSLHSKNGIFGVLGNNDIYIQEIKRLKGGRILVNEGVNLRINDTTFSIIGVDDPYTNRDDLKKAMDCIEKKDFTLLLAHSPKIIKEAAKKGISLVLTGHTHGGQICLPFIGPIVTLLKHGKRYFSGLYKVDNTFLYVNKGLGVTILPFRTFCQPEITFITLKTSKNEESAR
ncbi:MAG: metallophosphoesterase [bacterium]|nr:metallophosphoesterase [bacterium]